MEDCEEMRGKERKERREGVIRSRMGSTEEMRDEGIREGR